MSKRLRRAPSSRGPLRDPPALRSRDARFIRSTTRRRPLRDTTSAASAVPLGGQPRLQSGHPASQIEELFLVELSFRGRKEVALLLVGMMLDRLAQDRRLRLEGLLVGTKARKLLDQSLDDRVLLHRLSDDPASFRIVKFPAGRVEDLFLESSMNLEL